MGPDRPEDALLAGVCSRIAQTFKWNVWIIRVLFIGFLALKTLTAILVYAGLALVFHFASKTGRSTERSGGLESPELSDRNQRIEELERRFRDLEDSER